MPDLLVMINGVRHPIEHPTAAALIEYVARNQSLFAHTSGKALINYKGNSLTIEPSWVDQLKVEAAKH